MRFSRSPDFRKIKTAAAGTGVPEPDQEFILRHSSRRTFLRTTSFTAAGAMLSGSLVPAIAGPALGRQVQSSNLHRLDDGWEFRFSGGSPELASDSPGANWQAVTLPHCFNGTDSCDPDKAYFRGQGWYRTRLAIRNPYADGRTILHFQGAGQTTTLWIGSTQIGVHKGGYDEFAFDITDAIAHLPAAERAKEVTVTICCDNSPDHDRLPSDLSDFCLYGGLYRHVNLVYVPTVALDAVHILPTIDPDGSANVSIQARLYNPTQQNGPCRISIEVSDLQGRPVHRSSQSLPPWERFASLNEFRIPQPHLWSPDAPHLYRCRVTLSTAAGEVHLDERFGVRQIEFVEHGVFKVNGKRLLLRGTQRHADHAEVAAAMSDELVRQEMLLIRDMGANFIRLAHYQQDRLVLELCDELGLMVWEELAWCRSGVGSRAFQQNARDLLTHMVEQHYNHPSIILWGLGNEDDWPGEYPALDQGAIRTFMTEMHDLAHQLDDSRLTAFRRCDFARDIPDVYSPSIWAGWYRGNYHEYEQALEVERKRVKRFIHIEWGADSHAGRHAEDPEAVLREIATGTGTEERGLDYLKIGGEARVSRDGDWSETYACDLFDWHLKTQEKLDWLSGSAQWIFKDFASPLRGDNCIPRVNQKGVVQRDLTKKESYYVFQSYWTEKPMVHIYGHTWPVRWGRDGEMRTVRVYSNCESAELFLNGKSAGVQQRDSQDFPAAGLRWRVAFLPGRNRLRAVAVKNGVVVVDEIELTYQAKEWSKPSRLRLLEKVRNGSRIAIEATLVDAADVLCLDSRLNIRFSLEGAGRLIDNLGTTRASRELQLTNGRAEISVEVKGKCSLGAVIEGLSPAVLQVG